MLSFRDPIHGFIRTDDLETALVASRPMQRLRFIRQLGWTFLIFPGAEHSRFSHTLGTMHLAGRVYDALAAKSDGLLPKAPGCRERRLVRVAALLHDIGHAPYSHSAEDMFSEPIDHEEMTCRLIATPEMQEIFDRHGDGLDPVDVRQVLLKQAEGPLRLLTDIVTSELDVDKMDYLRRDSLYCGVEYGSYDLERLIDTVAPIEDPENGQWRLGVDHGGVHALEALVMARYYMFTQVYFNVTGKVMELHFSEWLRSTGIRWPAEPLEFLGHDDISVYQTMRRSEDRHARAIVHRERYSLAFETKEHLSAEERRQFQQLLPLLQERFGSENLLINHSAKDPHRLRKNRVLVRGYDGSLQPMAEASDFIRHMSRIDSYRVYSPEEIRQEVAAEVRRHWKSWAPLRGDGGH
ncbi:MAG: HD domain-containing protein [bacterium]|nr:HD domain-containing protein [bacterium]